MSRAERITNIARAETWKKFLTILETETWHEYFNDMSNLPHVLGARAATPFPRSKGGKLEMPGKASHSKRIGAQTDTWCERQEEICQRNNMLGNSFVK